MQEFMNVSAVLRDSLCKTFFIMNFCRSEHKYETPSGYATFWNHIIDAVDFRDDHLTLPNVTNAHVDTLLKNS